MENASKALLFAAGILIAIILITVAVGIVSQSNEAMKGATSGLSQTQLMTFNTKFTAYEGKKISGSNIEQLINTVNASNQEYADSDMTVEVVGVNVTIEGDKDKGYKFKGGKSATYSVDCEELNGAVYKITITGQPKS